MTDTNTLAPTDAEILALNAGEVHFSESPSKYPAAGFGTQYHAGAPGVLSFARAVLACKWGTHALASSEPDPMLPETKYNLGWASGWDAHARAHPPESGPVGFDHKTAAEFLNGKTVTDEAVRQFIAHSRRAHDDRDWLRNTLADLRREITRRDAEIALLKTSLLDAESPTQAAQAQVVPAPGVEAVSEREFKQFLSDVVAAAGLVTHGKKCKDLGRRLGEMSMRLRTAPKTAAARGAALAALKHPAVKPNMLVNGGALKLALNILRRAGKNEVADELECTAQAAPVDAATWQPIATAPKDGKAILLRSKKGRIADGLWSAANSRTGFWAWAYVHLEPDEWMPKPDSPAASAQEQQP